MKKTFQVFPILIFLIFFFAKTEGQTKTKFSYAAQKRFIPDELGRVYLGMQFRDFAANFDFKQSEVEDRYDFLQVTIPFDKGNITKMTFKVQGIPHDEKANLSHSVIITEKGEFGDYEREVRHLDKAKISAKGFVYEIVLFYKPDFDLKNYVLKTYGKPEETAQKGDQYYFFDSQWTKESADGLLWLIRAFHEDGKSLQLAGRIEGTEWGLD